MTKKSQSRVKRDRLKIPKRDDIASITMDREHIIFTTNDMLVNQLHRDGPRVAKSFDRLTKNDIADCSAVFGQVQGVLLRHLPRLGDTDFRRRRPDFYMARASIEVARHGYPRQYGAIARVLIETLATEIVIAVKAGALEVFHPGTLDSTKCITWSKAVLPPLGQYWGMLSNEFVHIGKTTQKSSPQSSIQRTMKRWALSFPRSAATCGFFT
jgi:hypothetical protein